MRWLAELLCSLGGLLLTVLSVPGANGVAATAASAADDVSAASSSAAGDNPLASTRTICCHVPLRNFTVASQ